MIQIDEVREGKIEEVIITDDFDLLVIEIGKKSHSFYITEYFTMTIFGKDDAEKQELERERKERLERIAERFEVKQIEKVKEKEVMAGMFDGKIVDIRPKVDVRNAVVTIRELVEEILEIVSLEEVEEVLEGMRRRKEGDG